MPTSNLSVKDVDYVLVSHVTIPSDAIMAGADPSALILGAAGAVNEALTVLAPEGTHVSVDGQLTGGLSNDVAAT